MEQMQEMSTCGKKLQITFTSRVTTYYAHQLYVFTANGLRKRKYAQLLQVSNNAFAMMESTPKQFILYVRKKGTRSNVCEWEGCLCTCVGVYDFLCVRIMCAFMCVFVTVFVRARARARVCKGDRLLKTDSRKDRQTGNTTKLSTKYKMKHINLSGSGVLAHAVHVITPILIFFCDYFELTFAPFEGMKPQSGR